MSQRPFLAPLSFPPPVSFDLSQLVRSRRITFSMYGRLNPLIWSFEMTMMTNQGLQRTDLRPFAEVMRRASFMKAIDRYFLIEPEDLSWKPANQP